MTSALCPLCQEYPTLTTFFEGEIISKKHPFLTRKWDADEDVDRKHWVNKSGTEGGSGMLLWRTVAVCAHARAARKAWRHLLSGCLLSPTLFANRGLSSKL